MKRVNKQQFTSSILLMFALTVVPFEVAHAKNIKQPRDKGALLYKVKESATPDQLKALNGILNRNMVATEKSLIDGKVKKSRAHNLPAGVTEEDLATQLLQTGAVEFAEPDYLVAPDAMPNDPKFSSQWHHTKIESQLAWDITTGNQNLKVAVCDSGINLHPDLVNNLLPGKNIVDGSTVTTDSGSGHGTLVAGTIGAVGNNSVGAAGLNWQVSILPGRISNSTDGWAYYSDMAACVTWAASQGAKVVNISYAAATATVEYAAKDMRAKGGLVFVSAGNESTDLGTTDEFPNLIVVGATDSADAKTSWSNYGARIDITAPGVNILTTTASGGYANAYGTSFSSPISAGIAALMFAANPSLTPAQVENIIESTAEDLGAAGKDPIYGFGRVNVARAVAQAAQTKANVLPVAVASANTLSGVAPLTVQLYGDNSYDPDGAITSDTWLLGSTTIAATPNTSYTFQSGGKYTIKLQVVDNSGGVSEASLTVNVTNPTTTTTTTKTTRGKKK